MLRSIRKCVLLISILASALPLWGQANPQDVIVPPPVGNSEILGRNLDAIFGGQTGWLRNWILTPAKDSSFACVSITNNTLGLLVYRLDALSPKDPSVTKLAGNQAAWQMLPVQSNLFASNATNQTGFAVGGGAIGSILISLPQTGKLALVPTLLLGPAVKLDWAVSYNNTGICGPVNYSTVYWADIAVGINADRTSYPLGTQRALGLASPVGFYTDATTFSACNVYARIINTAGGAPTLNLYIQDFNQFDPANYDDRISFTQFSGIAADQKKMASIVHTIAVDHAISQGALAANSEAGSMFSGGIQLFYHLGAGPPTYNVRVFGACSR